MGMRSHEGYKYVSALGSRTLEQGKVGRVKPRTHNRISDGN